jgi:ABC-type multidrug transport system fused ATPase/permease subunit
MAGNPRILVLDEATSALDNITQATVVETLNSLRITRIVVAHRLSTIRHADRIIVLDAGRVVDDGTYDELMAKPGAFRELALRQQT